MYMDMYCIITYLLSCLNIIVVSEKRLTTCTGVQLSKYEENVTTLALSVSCISTHTASG